ncbi:MAG: sigma-70 family RNA polymerase sigma factor [Bacilli bacterium]|nr:sigma-70 family RNA polymerase sigma factor [Bacilli bacterium]
MDYTNINDEELIHMVREESEDAKDILYEKYKYIIDIELRKYKRIAYALAYDVSELSQEALVGFADAINNYREDKEASLSSFITLCVDRRLQVAIKKAGRLKNQMIKEALSLEEEYNASSQLKELLSDNSLNDPLENMLKEENYNELKKKIKEELSDSEYEVYTYMINGLKYDEIANLINKNLKQVDNTIQRVKSKIRKILEER